MNAEEVANEIELRARSIATAINSLDRARSQRKEFERFCIGKVYRFKAELQNSQDYYEFSRELTSDLMIAIAEVLRKNVEKHEQELRRIA